MSDPYRKVQVGDPFDVPAPAYNAFVDAALFARQHKHGLAVRRQNDFTQTDVVRIRNDTGGDLSRFAVLGVSGVVFTYGAAPIEFGNLIVLTGDTPDADDHFQKFAIAIEPIAEDQIGYAVVSGVVQVQLDVVHEDHWFADIKDGYSDCLQSSLWGGARILYKESGVGTKWALINIGITGGWSYLGKLDGQLNAGSSATVSIWTGSTPSDSGINVTAYDWFLPSGNIAAGKKVLVEYFPHNKKPYVTAAEC